MLASLDVAERAGEGDGVAKTDLGPIKGQLKETLRELTALDGVAGQEMAVVRWLRERFAPLADEVTVDRMGNVLGDEARRRRAAPRHLRAFGRDRRARHGDRAGRQDSLREERRRDRDAARRAEGARRQCAGDRRRQGGPLAAAGRAADGAADPRSLHRCRLRHGGGGGRARHPHRHADHLRRAALRTDERRPRLRQGGR